MEPFENMELKNDGGLCLVGVTCDWLPGGKTNGIGSPSRISLGESSMDVLIVVALCGTVTV